MAQWHVAGGFACFQMSATVDFHMKTASPLPQLRGYLRSCPLRRLCTVYLLDSSCGNRLSVFLPDVKSTSLHFQHRAGLKQCATCFMHADVPQLQYCWVSVCSMQIKAKGEKGCDVAAAHARAGAAPGGRAICCPSVHTAVVPPASVVCMSILSPVTAAGHAFPLTIILSPVTAAGHAFPLTMS
jgi:hypothetical protein